MICRNCKTSVGENEDICPNCGHRLKRSKRALIFILTAFIVIAFIMFFQRRNYPGPVEVIPEDSQGTENLPSDSLEEENLNEIENTETAEEKETLPPVSNPDLNKPMDEVWEMLDTIIVYINDYYDYYGETVEFISKNGYLFDVPARDYVFVEDLAGLLEFDNKYINESVLFLYLRPDDLNGYGDLRVSESNALKIFAAYETKEGFAISAKDEPGGIISIADLGKVLDKYSWEHGNITNFSIDSDKFEQIIKAIKSFEENSEDSELSYDIRHMLADNKYVDIIVSPVGNSERMGHYVLEFNGDIFEVKVHGIENQLNYKKFVNVTIPDFNTNLMPNYNLNVVTKHLQSNFENITEMMRVNKLIEEKDFPVNFQSGTNDFIFLAFSSGRHFVGHFEKGIWQMYPVETYGEAVMLLQGLDKKPPLFILKHF